jgi:hypothetical protein
VCVSQRRPKFHKSQLKSKSCSRLRSGLRSGLRSRSRQDSGRRTQIPSMLYCIVFHCVYLMLRLFHARFPVVFAQLGSFSAAYHQLLFPPTPKQKQISLFSLLSPFLSHSISSLLSHLLSSVPSPLLRLVPHLLSQSASKNAIPTPPIHLPNPDQTSPSIQHNFMTNIKGSQYDPLSKHHQCQVQPFSNYMVLCPISVDIL